MFDIRQHTMLYKLELFNQIGKMERNKEIAGAIMIWFVLSWITSAFIAFFTFIGKSLI